MKARIHCDVMIGGNLHGWSFAEDEQSLRDAPHRGDAVEISLGDTALGRRYRNIPRPDVDKAIGHAHVVKGFEIPAMAAAAVGALVRGDGSFDVHLGFAGAKLGLAELPAHLTDFSTFRSLQLCDEGGPFRIVDLWFATDRELRVRIEKVSGVGLGAPPFKARFYQPEFGRQTQLALVGESIVEDKNGIAFLSPALRNPLLPVLVAVSTMDGDLVAVDAIPFPSLCRGGLHHAELRALAITHDPLSNLRVTSDFLLREFVGWPEAEAERSIGLVEVDLTGVSGAERIFQSDVVEWLTELIRVKLGVRNPGPSAPGATPDELLVQIIRRRFSPAQGEAKTQERLTLGIPGDALPTLSGLVSRRLGAIVSRDEISCTFATVSAAIGAPMWLVNLPALPAWLRDLQPAGEPVPYPTLTRRPGPSTHDGAAPNGFGLPMAIRFVDTTFHTEVTQTFPISPDFGAGPFRKRMSPRVRPADGVSVLISIRNGVPHVAALLESLAAQTVAEMIDVVIVNNRASPAVISQVKSMADDLFKGRVAIVDYDAPFNHSAQTNLAAGRAQGRFLLVADSDVILHDPRTVEALCMMADSESVTSAGCMLLRRKDQKTQELEFRSAGVFPSGLSFFSSPTVVFEEPDCSGELAMTTYPVAANSFSLAMVRTDVWKQLGGLDAVAFPTDCNDVDFGVRALRRGFLHLCTTAVSAYHSGRASRGTAFDAHAVRYLLSPGVESLFSTCTVLRRIS